MTRIAAISVQTFARLPAARPAAPTAARAEEQRGGWPAERGAALHEAAKIAGEALTALIAAQAHHGHHGDPHPEHGHDHGHRPPPVTQPPTTEPPPVVPPPVSEPPVAQPPAPAPTPLTVVADPAAGARASAMVSKVFAEGAVAEAARSAFTAAAAERRAAAYVAQGQAALTLLQGVGAYERVRRSAIG